MALVLSAKQRHFYNFSDAKINITHGSVRSGKTFVTNLKWIEYVKTGPKGKLLMSGRTKESLKENVLDDILDIVGEENFDYKEQKGELVLFGRKIEIRGAEKADAEKAIRGRTYAGWYGDEITIQHKEFVKQAITRCSVQGAQIFWTTNPDHPDHFILNDFIKNPVMRDEGISKSWHFLMKDNATLTTDYIRMIESSYSGVFYDRMIMGKWVLAKGVVYKDFYKPEVMRIPHNQIIEMCRQGKFVDYIAGVDWGFTHPMVGLILGVTLDNQYYVVAEYYRTEQLTEDLAAWFLQWEAFFKRKIRILYCDSAEADRIKIMRIHKLNAKGADKAINAGLNSVMSTMRANRFHMSDAAESLHLEFGKYRYPDKDEIVNTKNHTDPKDLPIDADNHAMDAIRYVIHNYEIYLGRVAARAIKGNKRKGNVK